MAQNIPSINGFTFLISSKYDEKIKLQNLNYEGLDDIIFNKEAKSYTYVRENDEHIDIKDIRLMFKQYRKQNINFVETLFSISTFPPISSNLLEDSLYK